MFRDSWCLERSTTTRPAVSTQLKHYTHQLGFIHIAWGQHTLDLPTYPGSTNHPGCQWQMKFSDLIIVLVVTRRLHPGWRVDPNYTQVTQTTKKNTQTKSITTVRPMIKQTQDVGGLSSKGASYDGPKINR